MTKDKPEEIIKQQKSEAANDGFSEMLTSMVDELPQAEEHVIENEKKKQAELDNIDEQPQTSPSGDKFDASIHVMGKDGKPSMTKTGKFRKKKGVVNPFEKENAQAKLESENMDSKASAEICQTLKRNVYDGIFDYKYTDERHVVHVAATTQYFIESGGVTLTPLQNLMILEGFMALELMRTEKGSKKITGLKAWAVSKYIKFKDRKKGKKNDTQSSGGTDGKRKDDTSKKTSETENNADRTPLVGT